MMSRRRIFASVASVAMASSACMAYPSNPWFQQAQSPAPQSALTSGATDASPEVMQAGGYQREDGPRVSIYAEVDNTNGTRLVRANFHLDDDAYIVVGHIDADGVLRIEFPDTPIDNGFARGHASYQTAQFFAGFAGQYRARFTSGLTRSANAYDSYDGGTGFVFVIASWQPMHFEKFSTAGHWDSFELTDADYLTNPRPAVNELASLLAGTNSSAYTIKFASVYDTQAPYAASNSLYSNSLGAQSCSGLGFGYSFGFPSSPFGFSAFNPVSTYGYGQSFFWRGSQYLYDAADDCYYNTGIGGAYLPYGYFPPGYGNGWSIAQTPSSPPPNNGRLIGIDRIRPPVTPQATPMHLAPGSAPDAGGSTTNASKMTLAPETKPQYRTRGLVAHEDPAGSVEVIPQRSYGGRAHDAGTQSSGFQGLVIRGNDNQSRGDQPSSNTPRVQSQSHNDTPRNDSPRVAPQTRSESPRADAPRMAPSPAPARADAPRSEPARTPPAGSSSSSSSSSSSGKPPSKN